MQRARQEETADVILTFYISLSLFFQKIKNVIKTLHDLQKMFEMP